MGRPERRTVSVLIGALAATCLVWHSVDLQRSLLDYRASHDVTNNNANVAFAALTRVRLGRLAPATIQQGVRRGNLRHLVFAVLHDPSERSDCIGGVRARQRGQTGWYLLTRQRLTGWAYPLPVRIPRR